MPLYDWQCQKCDKVQTVFSSMDDYKRNAPKCCGEVRRYFTAPSMIMGDIAPYKSMQTGEYIGGRAQHRAHLKQHGLIEVGNEKLPPRKPVPMPDLVPDLREAIREVRNGRR